MNFIEFHPAQPEQNDLHYTKVGVPVNWFFRVCSDLTERNPLHNRSRSPAVNRKLSISEGYQGPGSPQCEDTCAPAGPVRWT